MSRLLFSSATAALIIGAGTVPAMAQVTADQVWDNWQNLVAATGATMSGTESREGGVLTVSDVVTGLTEDGVEIASTIPFIRFAENGDGSVTVTMAPGIGLDVRDDREEFALVMEIAQPDFTLDVSGTPDAMRYTYSASTIDLSVVEFRAPNPGSGPDATMDLTATMRDLSGTYDITAGDITSFASDSTIGSVELMLDLVAPSDQGSLRIDLSSGQVRSSVGISNMELLDPDVDPLEAFAQGLRMNGSLGYDELSVSFAFQDGRDNAEGAYTASNAELDFLLSDDRFRYIIGMGATQARMMVPEFPVPIEGGFSEIRLGFDVPLTTGGGPAREMTFVTRVVDLALGDAVFAIFDPGQVIPRTPASVVFDISGRGVVDLSMANAPGDAFPGILESVSLDTMRLAFGGAEVTGNGSFTFDMSDTDTFDGLPAPIGRIDLRASGLNGLLDRVGQLGVMGPEEMMGTRMMIGMFGRPVGPDQVESTIEFTPGGGIAVNGMQMQ